MPNITMTVTAVLTEDEALRFAPNHVEVSVTICNECYSIVPLWLAPEHHKKMHDGS